jgi:propanol-preferring alcohol dehydrogenase
MMRAAQLLSPRTRLAIVHLPVPAPGPSQVLIKVSACGVCRTDLHLQDGDLADQTFPRTLGHEIVGVVCEVGQEATGLKVGDRVGIPWLASTDHSCAFCASQRENLCERAQFTGHTVDGGFAEFAVAHHEYCFPLPEHVSDAQAAPLLCAGLIGYRTLKLSSALESARAQSIGVYGFGAAAHLVTQVATQLGHRVFAFTRPGDAEAQAFALTCGAEWAGDSTARPPAPLDSALVFAPVGGVVAEALKSVAKGGVVVCGGIHMSDIAFPYALLWGERQLRSVANLTRADGREFFQLLRRVQVESHVLEYTLDNVNQALDDVRFGRIVGAAVVVF